MLGFVEDILFNKCETINSLCDIFAGTGVVGKRFNNEKTKIISNDFLSANYICLQTFLGTYEYKEKSISKKINHLNSMRDTDENYFSKHFGGTYFSVENARKIGAIRQEIEVIADNDSEKNILICSLLYAADKVANTVGHYDAFRKKLDIFQSVNLLIPAIDPFHNHANRIYKEDANTLIKKIYCDVLYIDPPYNSRQYSDTYHLLENLAEWKKPHVAGIGKKMDRSHIKSGYCLKAAITAFRDLIANADCKHILLSYNNTGVSKNGRSNARMRDGEILQVLSQKGEVEIFKKDYKAFTTGKSDGRTNAERIFYCRVTK
ncbi:Adenine-specific methyltransferase [uncultured Candidatus Thioglobus sp.]|nr:Adenine-specific methyltransferase [uncultured Candidatus Thioglobus sp.]